MQIKLYYYGFLRCQKDKINIFSLLNMLWRKALGDAGNMKALTSQPKKNEDRR